MKFILIFFAFLLLFSCNKTPIENISEEIIITKTSKTKYFLGDTIQIEGSGFGTVNNTSFYWFVNETDTMWFASRLAKTWSPNFIEIVIDEIFDINQIWIGRLNLKLATADVKIYPYPEIPTVTIPAGTYLQGDENGFADERVIRNVTISKDFAISTTEVTQRNWNLIMNYNNSLLKNQNLPISNISWREAISFCNTFSKLNGLDTCYEITEQNVIFNQNAKGWRLPTEAEWEYVAYLANVEQTKLNQFAWFNENSGFNSQIVATKSKDILGLFDLYGNVWEWCWDFYSGEYNPLDISDPTGVSFGTRRIKRGGSSNNGKIYLRKSNRTIPSNNITNTGIRLVRTL
jgi:hypothetical protein